MTQTTDAPINDVIAKINALPDDLDVFQMPIFTAGQLKALVQRLEQAERSLTNCLLTANKMLACRNNPTNNPEEWQHVRRFCQEAGVTNSILRQGTSLSE